MASADSRRAVRLSVAVATPDSLRTNTRGLASWLVRAAPARARGEVVLALVSDGRMRALNRAYRGMDYATDVLSFPVAPSPQPSPPSRGRGGRTPSPSATSWGRGGRTPSPSATSWGRESHGERNHLGDIVIASGVAARQARAAGHSLQTELRVLALHGLLHLLGFDHETDDGRMARTERRLRHAAGLPEGLIERSPR